MNILFICNEYPVYPHGGIGTVTQMLAEGLHARGHKTVVAGFYNTVSTPLSIDEQKGVLVYRVRQCKGRYYYFRSRIKLYLLVRKILKRHSIDIVEAPDFFGLLAFWPRLPVPVVIRLHGSVTYFLTEMGRPIYKNFFSYERSTLRKATSIVSVSKYTAERTKHIFQLRSSIKVIYNSVEIKPQDTMSEHLRDPYHVVYTGSLLRKKGVFALFEAWPEVLKVFPQAKLHLFGKDTLDEHGSSIQSALQQDLSSSHRESVTFHGHVDRNRILKELKIAAVAVFPSFSEAFALAPLEAMTQGCPIIFTKRASGPELINDGENGMLIDPSRPHEISQAIINVLSDPRFAAKIGAQGKKTVEARFGSHAVLLENEKMYNDLITLPQPR
jgi:glycosyltransferase involved in cell wall biosynthesis